MVSAVHALLAAVLFATINWIGKHSIGFGYVQLTLFAERDEAPAFNFLLRILAPSVFVILCSVVLYTAKWDYLVENIWRVAAYHVALRWLFNIAWSRSRLLNWPSQIVQGCVGVGLTYLAYVHLIAPRVPLFPDSKTLANELWIAIVAFLYAVLNNVRGSSIGSIRRKNRYIENTFNGMKHRFSHVIDGQLPSRIYELVAYAVLIHENFNRPIFMRKIEWIFFPMCKTLGIMQSAADRRISDLESVQIGIARLRGFAELAISEPEVTKWGTSTQYMHVRSAISHFNKDEDYVREIFDLMDNISARVELSYRAEFMAMHGTPGSLQSND